MLLYQYLLSALPLSGLASAQYRTISSETSGRSIRVKSFDGNESDLCNAGGVAHHAGWADLGNRHLFFWFHEARTSPETAPLLLWLQGGPGSSSLIGMVFENGPCLIDGPNSTVFNTYSWTESFNVIYLDQPAGVGFSYVDDDSFPGAIPNRTEISSLDVVDAIELLYTAFPHLAKVELHVAGESFGGRYVPVLGSSILEHNAAQSGKNDIPLRSIIVVNGWSNPVYQVPSLYDVGCHSYKSYPPFLEEPDCAKMSASVETCKEGLSRCAASRDAQDCIDTYPSCKNGISDVVFDLVDRSPYDRRRVDCAPDCYPEYGPILAYMNRTALLENHLEISNASHGRKEVWNVLYRDMEPLFVDSGDFLMSSGPQLERVLQDPDVDVLYMAGITDIACNPKGVNEALENAKWEKQSEYVDAAWKDLPWKSSLGSKGGRVKAVDGLWMVEVNDAGHYVPFDQPALALDLLKHWKSHLSHKDLEKEPPTAEEL